MFVLIIVVGICLLSNVSESVTNHCRLSSVQVSGHTDQTDREIFGPSHLAHGGSTRDDDIVSV